MEDSLVFRDEFYHRLVFESIMEMRQSGSLCDVILICDGEIPAHRLILSAASPYFRGMFNLGLKESKEERIVINSMDGDVLRAAIDFIYSGEVIAPDDLILPLLEASSLLQLGSLRSACMHKLIQLATPYSTFEYSGSLANKLGLLELGNYFHRLTIENFKAVAFGERKQQWLDAPFEIIAPLLCHLSIFSNPATLVLKAVLEWMLNDKTGIREKHLKVLLHILKNISKSDLENEVKELLLHKPDVHKWLLSHITQTEPSKNVTSTRELQVVVVIGGLSRNDAMTTAECYVADIPSSSSWTLYLPDNDILHPESGSILKTNVIDRVVPPMNFARVYAASAFLDHEIYVIGGESGRHETFGCRFPVRTEASVECYNIVSNKWRSMPGIPLPKDMLEANEEMDEEGEEDCLRLVGAAAAFVEGDLYVCGGKLEVIKGGKGEDYFPPSKWLVPSGLSGKTWVFNELKNKWMKCSPMHQPRAYHGAASVNGILYAVGGVGASRDGHFTDCLDSVERFDPWIGTWFKVNQMPSPRAYFGCMTFGRYIYVVGGHNLECCKDTVFRYDTIRNSWQVIEHPLRTPLDSLAVCSLKYPVDTAKNAQAHSFILGGRNSHFGIRDANVYNFNTNRWHCLQSLISPRIGASAGILRLPINVPASM